MDQRESEIVEAGKRLSELARWKLVAIGALGAAGLGFSRDAVPNADLVLCLLPLVCVYIDAMAYHLLLRTHVIATYRRTSLATSSPEETRWERFVAKARRRGAYGLESIFLFLSTLAVSGFLVAAPWLSCTSSLKSVLTRPDPLYYSGVLGVALLVGTFCYFMIARWLVSRLD